jgi:hypothetical protein
MIRAAVLALGLSVATSAWAAVQTVTLHCEAVYQPARSAWTRVVDIDMDQQRVRAVRIDGVPVYTFAIHGTWILTALDNERIQIDTAAQQWQSDFRGLARAQGRCERAPA